MKALIPVKRVPDYQVKVKVKGDGTGVELDKVKWIMNPFDEIAVEEALRQKEAGKISEVVLITVGPEDAQQTLRHGLAMGADAAILVKYDGTIDSDLAARVLAKMIARDSYGIVIMGKQAIDSDANQSAQILSTLLGWPQACFASKVEISGNGATVTREVDGGLETVELPLPCVISTDLRLNEPRYTPLPLIMKAKKVQIPIVDIQELGLTSLEPKVKVLRMTPPPKKQGGRKVGSLDELLSVLQNELKVL